MAPGGRPLLIATNPELASRHEQALAALAKVQAQRRQAADENKPGSVKVFDEQIRAVRDQLAQIERQLAELSLQPPQGGEWISPRIDRTRGAFVHQGEELGMVADLNQLIVRAVAGQENARLIQEALPQVEMRILGRPDLKVTGRIDKILPAGQEKLPSAALGYAAGGSIPISMEDRQGTRAAERFFEIRISPDPGSPVQLLSGQRLMVRFKTRPTPYLLQWWRAGLQLFQRRFHT